MKQLCVEQPKQLVLFGVVDVEWEVGSHQISEMTAHPVASGLLHHVIWNHKRVVVTVLVQDDDKARRTRCNLISFVVVFWLKQM